MRFSLLLCLIRHVIFIYFLLSLAKLTAWSRAVLICSNGEVLLQVWLWSNQKWSRMKSCSWSTEHMTFVTHARRTWRTCWTRGDQEQLHFSCFGSCSATAEFTFEQGQVRPRAWLTGSQGNGTGQTPNLSGMCATHELLLGNRTRANCYGNVPRLSVLYVFSPSGLGDNFQGYYVLSVSTVRRSCSSDIYWNLLGLRSEVIMYTHV